MLFAPVRPTKGSDLSGSISGVAAGISTHQMPAIMIQHATDSMQRSFALKTFLNPPPDAKLRDFRISS